MLYKYRSIYRSTYCSTIIASTKTVVKAIPFYLIAILFITNICIAENNFRKNRNPYHTSIVGSANILNSSFDAFGKNFGDTNASYEVQQLNKKIRFTTNILGLGRTKFSLNKFQQPSWEASFTDSKGKKIKDNSRLLILKGTLKSSRIKTEIPITATLHSRSKSSVKKLTAYLPRSFSFRGRYFTVTANINTNNSVVSAKVKSTPGTILFNKDCGDNHNDDDHHINPSNSKFVSENENLFAINGIDYDGHKTSQANVSSATATKVLTISTDADHEYFSIHRGDTNTKIAGLVSIASDIYTRNFGVKFKILEQNAFTSSANDPYDTRNSDSLLDQFREYTLENRHLGKANVYHMFTGKDLLGSTIGIAFSGFSNNDLGVICRSNDRFSFGLSQTLGNTQVDAITLTHELSHNFSASHDSDREDGFIMSAGLPSPPPTDFSPSSFTDIENYINEFGSCLSANDDIDIAPTSTPRPIITSTPVPVPTSTPRPPRPTTTPTPEPEFTISIPLPPTNTPTIDSELPTAIDRNSDIRITKFKFTSSISSLSLIRLSLKVKANKNIGNRCEVILTSGFDNSILSASDALGSYFSTSIRSRPRILVNDNTDILANIVCDNRTSLIARKAINIPLEGRPSLKTQAAQSISGWNDSFKENSKVSSRAIRKRKRRRKKRRKK